MQGQYPKTGSDFHLAHFTWPFPVILPYYLPYITRSTASASLDKATTNRQINSNPFAQSSVTFPSLLLWSSALREEHGVRMFENRVLRRITHGPKREEVTRDWRKMRNKKLHKLHSSPNNITVIKSRSIRWAGHVARMEIKKYTQNFGRITWREETSCKT